MKSYSCFISKDDYESFYAPGNEHENNPYIGRPENKQDPESDYWVCGMPSEEADKFIEDHTNEDGSLDYAGMEKDIFGEENCTGRFDKGVYRVDYETDGEVRATSPEESSNLTGVCDGTGKLPDGKSSDHECKNVPRENITKAEEVKGTNPSEDESKGETPETPTEASQLEDEQQERAPPEQDNDYDYYSGIS